jgi:tetratricopeptide (TPR) repeat protein
LLCLSVSFPVPARTQKRSERGARPAYAEYLKGLLSERYGDSSCALQEYIKARRTDGGSTSLKLKLAIQYIKLNEHQNAVDILTGLLTEEPLNVDAHLLLILLHSTGGNEEKATAAYGEMLNRLYAADQTNVSIAESLAQFKLQERDLAGSLEIYQGLIKTHPEYDDAYFWVGYLHEESGSRQDAIALWKALLERNPEHSDGLNSLGYIYAEEGIYLDDARLMIEKALEKRPESPAYLDSLGWVYYKQGRYEEACSYIEKAAAMLDDPVIMDHMGDVYLAMGKKEQALKAWRQIVEADPENKIIKEKIRKIEDERAVGKN